MALNTKGGEFVPLYGVDGYWVLIILKTYT